MHAALHSKNSAWLMTAATVAGWKGLAIRNVGSTRRPVRSRSGKAVMNTTGTQSSVRSSLTASIPERLVLDDQHVGRDFACEFTPGLFEQTFQIRDGHVEDFCRILFGERFERDE